MKLLKGIVLYYFSGHSDIFVLFLFVNTSVYSQNHDICIAPRKNANKTCYYMNKPALNA